VRPYCEGSLKCRLVEDVLPCDGSDENQGVYMRNTGSVFVLIVFMLLLSACSGQGEKEAPASENPGNAGLANPASVHCEQNGGTLEIRTDKDGGQYGVCIFPDGSECEEWAYFRQECQPGVSPDVIPTQPSNGYVNEELGFSFDPPVTWTIADYGDHLLFRRSLDGNEYVLFVGFQTASEEPKPFRTSRPAGEFVKGGPFMLLGQKHAKNLLIFEGKTKVAEYGSGLEAGDLRLYIFLDPVSEQGVAYEDLDIPLQVIAEADQIVESFSLRP